VIDALLRAGFLERLIGAPLLCRIARRAATVGHASADLADHALDIADVLGLDLGGVGLEVDAHVGGLVVIGLERPFHDSLGEGLVAAARRRQSLRRVGRLLLGFLGAICQYPCCERCTIAALVRAWLGSVGRRRHNHGRKRDRHEIVQPRITASRQIRHDLVSQARTGRQHAAQRGAADSGLDDLGDASRRTVGRGRSGRIATGDSTLRHRCPGP
jgi:hypothetical protein